MVRPWTCRGTAIFLYLVRRITVSATSKRARSTSKTKRHQETELSTQAPQVPQERFDLQILQSIRRIMRAVDIYSRKLRSQYELTAPQLICLGTVVERGPLTVSEIAEMVFLSPSTVVGILDRLETRGLVQRERDTVDRRVVNILATAAGKKVVNKAPSALQDGLHEGLQKLPQLEQATIALSLKRVVELMEAGRIDASPILETAPISEHAKHDVKPEKGGS
ncbi:MarR family transcriptional regulator [candidate division GN15 bacterium]|nr:MarR family transcriptional regulator [candidate division GN15 bacterium]